MAGRSQYAGGRQILGVPDTAPRATRIRTTVLSASLLAVRERGLFDAYMRELPPEHHETVVGIVAGDWVPIATGLAHYAALDRLGMSAAEQYRIGEDVGLRINRGVLGTAARLAGASGATPWTVLEQIPRLWARMVDGGGVALYDLGPKDARIEFVRCALASVAYCRNGWRGMVAGAMTPFCRKIYVNEIRELGDAETLAMHASWA